MNPYFMQVSKLSFFIHIICYYYITYTNEQTKNTQDFAILT